MTLSSKRDGLMIDRAHYVSAGKEEAERRELRMLKELLRHPLDLSKETSLPDRSAGVSSSSYTDFFRWLRVQKTRRMPREDEEVGRGEGGEGEWQTKKSAT
jgi:hypothetical protein